jgi:hypothetical protein
MGRLNWRKIGYWGLLTLPTAAHAQVPFSLGSDDPNKPVNVVGGTGALDLITVHANSPGVPLKHGNVMPGSERVQLGAAVLQRGEDYSIDYPTGVVYIRRAMKVGDSVTVSYRYDKDKPAASSAGMNMSGIAGFSFNIAPGAMNMVLGFGMTERTADGQVMQTNLFGINNDFKLAGGSLKGLYYFGQRQKASTDSLYATDTPGRDVAEGDSQIILQSLQTKAMGGSISADYQQISSNFRAFGAAGASGYNAGQLEKEKGLTRLGFNAKDLKVGAIGFGANFKTVSDGDAGIEWRGANFNTGGLKVNWNSQRIDPDFKRFNDIAEADRAQLMKEAGLARENLDAALGFKGGGLSFRTLSIEDMRNGHGLESREIGLNIDKVKFNLKDQSVDKTFARIASLKGDEQAMYSREIGLKRQWLSLEMGILGKDFQPIKFAQNFIDSESGGFKSQEISAGGKNWSLEHTTKNFDKGFTGFAPLSATQEGDAQIAAIANMYGKGLAPNVGAERGWLLRSAGLERSFDRISGSPFKNWNFTFENLALKGQLDDGSVQTWALANKDLDLKYRRQSIGSKFNELSSMLDLERQRLGTIAGLDRTDFAANFRLKNGTLAYSQLHANTNEGSISRQQFAYADKRLQVAANTREVDPGVSNANQLVDPEKDLLSQLRGYKQHDLKVAWQILPSVNLNFYDYAADSDSLDQQNKIQNLILNWKPSRNTEFNYTKLQNKSDNPISVLFANMTEKMSLYQNLGKMGTIRLVNEQQQFDGQNGAMPDFKRFYLAYETSLDKNTKVMTEQTRTSFDNGDKEDISANTVSTNLNKRLGVSLTETKIDRNGDDRDQNNRNYGFWYDLGNGIQIAYGYARQLNGNNGQTQQSLSVGQTAGQTAPEQAGTNPQASLGNLQFGGGYGERSWDGSTERTQAFSKMSIGTKKPFTAGFLHDVTLNYGVDTASDYSKWIRENKMLNFGAKIGSNSIGYSYLGQMFTNGYRAVDRTFTFATDQSPKRWLTASMFYKLRTMPTGDQVMIRNYNISARPSKNLEITHQLITNPEQQRGDAILGSVPSPERNSVWKLDYKVPGQMTIGGEWREKRNDQNNALQRLAALNVTLFEKSGSPLKLSYGLEEVNGNGIQRRLASRYSLQFDQHPGPNQTLSFFAGNVSYRYDIAEGFKKDNWSLRMDYSLRF